MAQYNIPDYDQLKSYRIWDAHYHGFGVSEKRAATNKKMLEIGRRMGVERWITFDIHKVHRDKGTDLYDKREYLIKNRSFMSGLLIIEPGYPEESTAAMQEWIGDGPCIGIKYSGVNKSGVTCDHPNNDQIIQKARDLNAVIYIHTWTKTGGVVRTLGGGNFIGESAPWHVAELAARHPDVRMICGPAGGDWEIGARTIRPFENVYLEFSGGDPQSGGVDLAVNELGADRIVWGGHGPSRSYSTEIAKVLDGNLTFKEQFKIFGANYRDLSREIFNDKGIPQNP